MKLVEGTYKNPSLINIDYYWKYISKYTNDNIFKQKIKKGICLFIKRRKTDNSYLKNMKYHIDLPLWHYASKCITFDNYRSNNKTDINYYRICKGCHWMQDAFLYLVKKLDPTKNWIILYSDYHSCIINDERTIVVDLFAKPYKYNTGMDSLNAVYKKKFFMQ